MRARELGVEGARKRDGESEKGRDKILEMERH